MSSLLNIEELPSDLQWDIEVAEDMAARAWPAGKRTQIGCLLRTPQGLYHGTNIKFPEGTGVDTTHADRMALDQALADHVTRLGRVVLGVINRDIPNAEIYGPCFSCRGRYTHALEALGQTDVPFIVVGAEGSMPKGKALHFMLSESAPLVEVAGSDLVRPDSVQLISN